MTPDFDEWYRHEHPRLVSALTLVAGNPSIAAEVADEAFARALERWSRVAQMDSPRGWTYRTALNVLRRQARRSLLEARLLRRAGGHPADGAARPLDWSVEMWDALRRLPPRERTALALQHVVGMTTAEIAEAMHIAPGTVGSTLHAARRNLAQSLAPEPDPAPTPAVATSVARTAKPEEDDGDA